MIEDLRQGGRITSLRIFVTMYLVVGSRHVSNKNTLLGFLFGVILMALIGSSRGFSFSDPVSVVFGVFGNFFVFDTVVFSYYASITQLMLLEVVDSSFVLQSITDLLAYIITFGLAPGDAYNISGAAAEAGFVSVGGGVAPSFFYFWFGWVGVFAFGLIMAVVCRFMMVRDGFYGVALVAVIAACPRWFLYGPWIFLKTLILIGIAVLLYRALVYAVKPYSFTRI